MRPLEQACLCPKDVKAGQAVLDLTDPAFTPPQAAPHPGLLRQGSSVGFLLLTVPRAEIRVPRRCVVLPGVRGTRSTNLRAGSLPKSTTHCLPVRFAPRMILKAF